MLEELGVVTQATERYAWVQMQRKHSCGQCASNNSCGTASLAQIMGRKITNIRVENSLAVKVGDNVIIGLEEQALVKTALITYLTPLLSLFIFALSYEYLAINFNLPTAEIFTVLAAALGLALGLMLVKYISRYWMYMSLYQPVLLRVQDGCQVQFDLN
jgi:sigma-E factor negative regulatory protein RseC